VFGEIAMRVVRSFITAFGFAAIFFGMTVMSALVMGAVRGQF
jgi:hypothetical protein